MISTLDAVLDGTMHTRDDEAAGASAAARQHPIHACQRELVLGDWAPALAAANTNAAIEALRMRFLISVLEITSIRSERRCPPSWRSPRGRFDRSRRSPRRAWPSTSR